MYLGADGNIDRRLTRAGYLAPGVPGTVRGLALAHKKFGKLPWKDVVMPGVQLAEQGFALSAGARAQPQPRARGPDGPASAPRSPRTASRAAASGRAGDRLVLTDLGRTLRAIATDGPDAFYKGWIADRIADDMKANGGLITKARISPRTAPGSARRCAARYRGFEIVSMPPPSSGGVALIEMLNILEPSESQGRRAC